MCDLNGLGVTSRVTKQNIASWVVDFLLVLFFSQIIQTIQSGQGQLRTLIARSVINGDIMLINGDQGVI